MYAFANLKMNIHFFHTAHYNVVMSKLTCCIKNEFVILCLLYLDKIV